MPIDFTNASHTDILKHHVPYLIMPTPGAPEDTYWQEDWQPALVNVGFVAIVSWANADNFILDMLGSHQQVGGKIRRVNPEPHPYFDFLYCIGCKDVGNIKDANAGTPWADAAANNAIQFDYIKYHCTFAAFLYDIAEDSEVDASDTGELIRYVERRSKQIGQSLQANAVTFEFVTVSPSGFHDPVPTPPALHIPYRELNYVWHYVPGPIGVLKANADKFYGAVNALTFDAGGDGPDDDGYPAQSLMYLGMDYEPIPSTPLGNRLYRVTHKFAFFEHGFNAAYRAARGAIYTDAVGTPNTYFDQIRIRDAPGGGPNQPYLSDDFDDLFLL